MSTISVIIPAYNRPNLLPRAIDSILAQTYKDFDILVVQNGIKNNSDEIVREYQKKGFPISYKFEQRGGAAHARNVGILQTRGEYIAFLEDDDSWHPEKLQKQFAAITAAERIGLVTCRSREVTAAGDFIRLRPEKYVPCNFETLATLPCVKVISSLSGVLMRRSVFDRLGLFGEYYKIASDVEFYIEVARHFECASLEDDLFDYTLHDGNLSGNLELGWWEAVQILKKVKPSKKHGVTKKMINSNISWRAMKFYALGSDSIDSKNYRKAWESYMRAIQSDPCIGLNVRWGKHRNGTYSFAKPYLAVFYALLKDASAQISCRSSAGQAG